MNAALADLIATVPDFPEPGVMFADITPLLASPEGFAAAVDALTDSAPNGVDAVVGMEARGFIFAAPLALRLGAGLVPIRKPGKLPRAVVATHFELEYRRETLVMHADALRPGDRVLVVDDVLATGGTGRAAVDLVEQLGGTVVGASVLIELTYLGGRKALHDRGIETVSSVITVDRP